MKRFMAHFSGMVATLALFSAAMHANVACCYFAYQPELPEGAKSLRKF